MKEGRKIRGETAVLLRFYEFIYIQRVYIHKLYTVLAGCAALHRLKVKEKIIDETPLGYVHHKIHGIGIRLSCGVHSCLMLHSLSHYLSIFGGCLFNESWHKFQVQLIQKVTGRYHIHESMYILSTECKVILYGWQGDLR